MDVQKFLKSFVTGTYKTKRFGQYKIFDTNEVTGEPFNCAILMFRASDYCSSLPQVVAIYFGKGIAISNSNFKHNRLRGVQIAEYSAPLSTIHKKSDITESILVDHNSDGINPVAVVDIGGTDYLLDTAPIDETIPMSYDTFVNSNRKEKRSTRPDRKTLIPLEGKVSSTYEARRSLVPDEAKSTHGSFYFSGLWFMPSERKMLDLSSPELQDMRNVYSNVPLPSLHNIPREQLADEELFSSYKLRKKDSSSGEFMWEKKLSTWSPIGREYAAKLKQWYLTKLKLYAALNTDGSANIDASRLAAANGVTSGIYIDFKNIQIINGKRYTIGKISSTEASINLNQVHEVLYPCTNDQ
jgi:hypothetical protein